MYYKITAKKWFQKSYGNTYHSVLVEKVTGAGDNYRKRTIGFQPFAYGYGDHYINTAAGILGISEEELRKDIMQNPDKYAIFCSDVNRKKDL